MKIGYARVSTIDQNPDLQLRALQRAGCERIFEDKLSGSMLRRPGLDEAISLAGPGDVLVVWRLDRLGRSLSHLIETIGALGDKGCGFLSLTENIDTTTAGGRLLFHMMGALAVFERSLIEERTRAGLLAAKARGVKSGRPSSMTQAKMDHAKKLIEAGVRPRDVAKTLGVGRSTLYRALSSR